MPCDCQFLCCFPRCVISWSAVCDCVTLLVISTYFFFCVDFKYFYPQNQGGLYVTFNLPFSVVLGLMVSPVLDWYWLTLEGSPDTSLFFL